MSQLGRLFHRCSHCGLIRLCSFHGNAWTCDECHDPRASGLIEVEDA